MNETIVDLSKPPRPAEITTEICIVGSGAAGGTAAWELARAGHEVVVVEEGGDFTGFDLTGRDAEMYDQLYMDRGGRATSDLSISVLQGRVLGGGTMINACDVVPFPDGVLRHWMRKFHLTGYTPEALAPFTREALRDLSASRPEAADLNENNRIVRRGAEALGWRGEIMMHNRVGCAGLGICLLGCPLDAKRNARFVAIPEAMKAGARFFVRGRAVRIEDARKEIKRVHVAALDPRGYHEEARLTLRARVVILAANAVASAQLLLRSGIGNDHVGRHLMLQPQLPITAEFEEEVRFFRGIPQSYAVTEFEDLDHPEEGWWGFRIEPISGTPGIVASLLPLMGPEGKRTMTRYPHFAASLLLLPDRPVGRVRVERSGRLRIDYPIDEAHRARFREAIRAAVRIYLAAGARRVVLPTTPPVVFERTADLARVEEIPLRAAATPFISAHQQGGIRFAPSPRDGAADPEGRVFGARDIYAFDSAGFPSSASSHTMTPIMTVSRFLSRQLITHLRT